MTEGVRCGRVRAGTGAVGAAGCAGAVLLGLPAALALGVAGEQLVHAVRAHRVGVGVGRVRAGGRVVAEVLAGDAGRQRGVVGEVGGVLAGPASAAADVRFVVPSAPNVSKGGAKPGSTVGANVASRSKAGAGGTGGLAARSVGCGLIGVGAVGAVGGTMVGAAR